MRIIAFIAIGMALIIGAPVGYFFLSQEPECDPTTREVAMRGDKGFELRFTVPMLAVSYSNVGDEMFVRDMEETRQSHYADFKLLSAPQSFTIEDSIHKTSARCEPYELVSMLDADGKIFHMYLDDYLTFKEGKKPILSSRFTSRVEPFFEPNSDMTHSYIVRFKPPAELADAKVPYPDSVLNNALAGLKLNFNELGFAFDVSSMRHSHANAVLKLDIHSASYLAHRMDYFGITRLSPMAN